MIISIGMFAWNEEDVIEGAIRSLLQQSVFRGHKGCFDNAVWEIVVVANGCIDSTVEVARRTLEVCTEELRSGIVRGSVCEIKEAGKSNAWNKFVHERSHPDTGIFVMLDSDIEFGDPDTIFNSVQLLLDDPSCLVAVDKPLKHFAKKERPTFLEKLSLKFSDQTLDGNPAIAGSFYCARVHTLKSVWMPKGLSCEDGFLKAMVITDAFRSEVNPRSIRRADNASHFYEGLTNPLAIFKHELRMVIGTTLNCYLTWDFLLFAIHPNGPGAGELIRTRLERDPDWYKKFLNNEIKNRGYWVLPRNILWRRISPLRSLRPRQWLRRLPLAIVGFLVDLPVFLAANRRLKKGTAIGYW